jgi:hypothetical protein
MRVYCSTTTETCRVPSFHFRAKLVRCGARAMPSQRRMCAREWAAAPVLDASTAVTVEMNASAHAVSELGSKYL